MNTATKCLFGGALVAAGLATHEAHAQEFLFIDSTASAYVNWTSYTGEGGLDSFSGPGPWGVSSFAQRGFHFGNAYAWGGSTSIGAYVWAYVLEADVSVDTHFTVTSNAFVTHYSYLGDSIDSIAITDLTTGAVLTAIDDGGGLGFELLAEHEYRLLYSVSDFGSMTLTIYFPPCSAADLSAPFGQLNFSDVSAFLSLFSDEDPTADLNEDGRWNFFDVSAFLNAFTAGCP